MVVIGTRNHKTDTGISGILFVAAPFWIAMSLTHLAPLLQRKNRQDPNPYMVWGYTVIMGMLLRNMVFNRGTAAAFVIVATVFLGITMFGWRAVVAHRATT
jgi:FtsH-binding integral membrane protein